MAGERGKTGHTGKPENGFDGLMLAGIAAVVNGAGLIFDACTLPLSPEPMAWLGLGLVGGGLFAMKLARTLQISWHITRAMQTSLPKRTPNQIKSLDRSFREVFVWLILALSGLTAFAYLSPYTEPLPFSRVNLLETAQRAQILAFLACLILAFTPALTGFWLQARVEEKTRQQKDEKYRIFRDDSISAETFWTGIGIIGGLCALALWAAGETTKGDEGGFPEGFALIVMLLVVTLFVSFIFVPQIGRLFRQQRETREATGFVAPQGTFPLEAPARLASLFDSGLVRLVAPLSGATQKGVPHLLVILILLPLTALGFGLAAPWGLFPIAIGMLLVVAVGRRWAWIEEDRETASRLLKTDTSEIQIGFDNDLKDEALLGYAFLFILVPLSLHQFWGWQTDAFEVTEGADVSNVFLAWLSFFGAELAKAVPFVDWWEIYSVDLKSPIAPSETSALGKHLTFLSRVMVDLVIIAALFQAISIWQRNRAQKRLYDIGQVNHFDPFTERDFFEAAFLPGAGEPKAEFQKKVRDHVSAREALRLPAEPYDPQRLSDLLKSDNEAVRKAALWMVHEFQLLTGPPQEQIRQLVNHWLNLSFPQLSGSHRQADRRRLLNEKHKFEQLLAALETDTSVMRKSETGLLLGLIENIRQVPEFSFSQIEAIRLLGKLRNEYALLALAAHIIPPVETEWRQRIQQKFGIAPNLYLGQAPMRIKAYEALEMFGLNPAVSPTIRAKALRLLDQMAESDAATPCRERAALAGRRIREKFGTVDLLPETETSEDEPDTDEEQ